MDNTVATVVKRNLCTACGTCQSVCPHGAIAMSRSAADFIVPAVDPDKCTKCGLCLLSCPGTGLPKELTGGFKDIFRGENLCAFIGRAADEALWKNGQSGGVVSALLLYLLETGKVDGVAVNVFDGKTKRTAVKKVRTKQELLEAQGSYYIQSAVNTETIGDGNEKTAAVVLGCQAEGIALARKYANGRGTPAYLIGLVCAGNHSGLLLDDLVKQSRLKDVTSFRFRDKAAGGWPGNISVSAGERRAVLDKSRRMALKDVYGNFRCQCCFDQMNVYSDVVVGDPWGIDRKDRSKGYSVVFARTEKGRELLEGAARDGYIIAETVPLEDVYNGQTVDSRLMPQFFALQRICEKEGIPFPKYDISREDYPCPEVDGKKAKAYRESLLFKNVIQGMGSRDDVNKAIGRMKTRVALRGIPEKGEAQARRVLGRIRRLIGKRKA
jgi:coenzyme F420 hydrogenase subunit beta